MPGWKYSSTHVELFDSYGNAFGYNFVGRRQPWNLFTPPPSINAYTSLQYNRTINGSGNDELTIEVLGWLDAPKLMNNNRLVAWRNYKDDNNNSKRGIDLETTWLLKYWSKDYVRVGGGMVKKTIIKAVPAINMLTWRVVGYTDNGSVGSLERYLNTPADDIMKKMVTNNFVTIGAVLITAPPTNGYGPGRSVTPYLTVAPPLGQAPNQSVFGAWKELQTMFKGMCDACAANTGTFLYYDIVSDTSSSMEFRTFLNQRGADRTYASGMPLVFKPSRGNIIEAHRSKDFRKEYNFVYALGKADGTARQIETQFDSTLINANAFGRREIVIKAANTHDNAAVQTEAGKKLQSGRALDVFTATVVDGGASKRGRDIGGWDFGDKIEAEYDDDKFTCHIDAIAVKIDQKTGEKCTVSLKNDSSIYP